MAWPTSPPVHDSAVATVSPRAEADGLEPLGERDERVVGHRRRLLAARLLGRRGRREQPRLGDASPAERAERLAVEREVRDARVAGPDLDRGLAGERQRACRPAASCRPRPIVGSSLPSTQTLSQAEPPSIDDDEVHALEADRDVPWSGRPSCPGREAAVTVIDQRPAVELDGHAERAVVGRRRRSAGSAAPAAATGWRRRGPGVGAGARRPDRARSPRR